MKWCLKWDGRLDFYDTLLQRGSIREEDLEPEVGVFSVYFDWFFELDTCRVASHNSPIPFTAIYNFATIKEIENFDEFLYLMRLLDNVVMKHREKQNDNANKNNSSKG